MIMNNREIEKINNLNLKPLEKKLYEIDKYEEGLVKEFDDGLIVILGDILEQILEIAENVTYDNSAEFRELVINNKTYKVPINFLLKFHKSYISDSILKEKFEQKLKVWFDDKTDQLRSVLTKDRTNEDIKNIVSPSFALASVAITAFHEKPNVILKDVQKLASLALNDENIAELSLSDGKTLSQVLVSYLQALRGKGVHVINANEYLSNRNYFETKPIYEGLGLRVGFVYQNEEDYANSIGKKYEKLKDIKQKAYKCDITYGSKEAFASDYLRDLITQKKEDFFQRIERVGFALIDEVDKCLIDDAESPYQISYNGPTYKNNMSLLSLCEMLKIDYDSVIDKIRNMNINIDRLTFEDARYISITFAHTELMPDSTIFQEAAQRFFKFQNIFKIDDNMVGFKSSREAYEAFLDDKISDNKIVRNKYGIIFCDELKEFKISDKCYREFIKYCYFTNHVNTYLAIYEDKIGNDKTYIENEDYYYINNKIRLTMEGANKILNDINYPIFIEDYNNFLSYSNEESSIMMTYLQKCVFANLLMKNNEDYIVENNKVKKLKNGKIVDNSVYANGLQQAIEIKEKIKEDYRTKGEIVTSSITQKDFFAGYDFVSGLTTTSSKKIFGEVYGKSTIEIPKSDFYSFYSKRKKEDARAPLDILKKDIKYIINNDDKINLIVNSIIESQQTNPKQPVLVVVSNYDEIKILEDKLKDNNISFNILNTKTNEDEALDLSKAGISDNVTILRETDGRGIDIKLGGDRNTIIDIALNRHIKLLEKKYNSFLEFNSQERRYLRNKVENAISSNLWTKEEEEKNRKKLELNGFKVITTGLFKTKRSDRQIEERCGNNGVCERFISIDDFKKIGLDNFNNGESIDKFFNKFQKNDDNTLIIDEKTLNTIDDKIIAFQKNIEEEIKENIKTSQKLNSYTTKLIEEYRDRRRKIITNQLEFRPIVTSFIVDKELTNEDLTTPINKSNLIIEIEAISLEIKKVLGITFDYNIIEKSNVNLLELKNAIIRTVNERMKIINEDEIKKILLMQNDYVVANAEVFLDSSFTTRNIGTLSLGLENRLDSFVNIDVSNNMRNLLYDSYKAALSSVLGLSLDKEEFKKLEMLKDRIYNMEIKNKSESFEVIKPKLKVTNTNVIDKLKEIKKKIEKEDKEKLEKINKILEKKLKKEDKEDGILLYKNLNIRPVKFAKSLSSSKTSNLVMINSTKNKNKSLMKL